MVRPFFRVLIAAVLCALCAAAVASAGDRGRASGQASSAPAKRCSASPSCIPDGHGAVQFTGDSGCNWTGKVSWGDGKSDTVHYTSSSLIDHQYANQGTWTVHLTGSGVPNNPDTTTCTFTPSSFTFDYPFTADQRAIFIRAKQLAGKTRKPAAKTKSTFKKIEKHGGAHASKPLLKKGSKLADALFKLGDKGKQVAEDWVKDNIAKHLSAALGVGQESLKKLYGFLGTLTDLSKFPNSAVRAADSLYARNNDFKEDLDRLANLTTGCASASYNSCNAEAKRSIAVASQVMIQDGSVKQFINDAVAAGEAASKVSLSLPDE